jgi:hypothetical protein
MWQVGLCGSGEVHTGFWWGNLRGKRQVERSVRRWEDVTKIYFQEVDWGHGLRLSGSR